MISYIFIILVSFFVTFLVSFPFIRFLYKFNIRRVSKAELDAILPGKQVKFGTPIMGGAVIVFTILILSTLLLREWEYYPAIMLITILGGIFGAIDEYTNTLGRTFKAIRLSIGQVGFSIFPVYGPLAKVKKILLTPWKAFEEAIRVMGSEQRGMKAHYKFLMQLALVIVPVIYLYLNQNGTTFTFPIYGTFNLGFIYIPLIVIYFLGFLNAFGITDGLDGLSAGTHSIAFGLYGILAAYLGYQEVAYLAFILLGAELAFLYFNIFPARMEMSDVGTMPIGLIFALIPLLLHREFSVLFIGAIFIIEIISSVSQQWSVKLTGKRLFLVAPIHHHFEKLGWPETKVTQRFWLFTLITGLIGLALAIL
jgi:phospho-N-acetylmuramoyl-pentapeptide-transferase